MGGTKITRKTLRLPSPVDGLSLAVEKMEPAGGIRGIVQISHGMAEHKERYEDFMTFLAENGYLCVIHDHRGHGGSVRRPEDLGYFYTEDPAALAEDLYAVTAMIRAEHPQVPLYLFSHSMGTLVARSYLKRHDRALSGLVLCGPPTRNPLVGLALALAGLTRGKALAARRGRLLNRLTFGGAYRRFGGENQWLSSDPEQVARYQRDPLCGFIFTNNGMLNLYRLQQAAFDPADWQVANPGLPVLLMAGSDDPVIGSEARFFELKDFLNRLGYRQVDAKLYPGLRHELLNERDRSAVYRDVLQFLQGC